MSDFNGQHIIENAIAIWPDSLFQAKAHKDEKDPNAKKSHSLTLLVPKGGEQAKQVGQLILACAGANFAGFPVTELKTEFFIADGDKEADKQKALGKNREAFRGYTVIKINTPESQPPQVIHLNGKPVMPPEFQGGCVVHAAINISPKKNNDGTPGVKAYMNHIMLVNKVGEVHPTYGELKMIGGVDASSVFSKYMGQERATNPSDGIAEGGQAAGQPDLSSLGF